MDKKDNNFGSEKKSANPDDAKRGEKRDDQPQPLHRFSDPKEGSEKIVDDKNR